MLGKRRSKEEEEDNLALGLKLDLERKTKIPRELQERHWYGDSDSSDDDQWIDPGICNEVDDQENYEVDEPDEWIDPDDDLKLCFRSGVAVYYEDDDQEHVDEPVRKSTDVNTYAAPAPYAGDNEENWALPGILVTVPKLGEDSSAVGVVQEVHPDGSCSVAVKSNENEEILIARHNEIKIVPPKVSDKIKIIGGVCRGVTGEFIDVHGREAGDNEENWTLSDILVTAHKLGEDSSSVGVVKEVHEDGSCSVALKSNKNEEILIVRHNEIKIIPPKVSDKIKIIGGVYRGVNGELIDVEGSEGTILVDDSPNVMILVDMDFIAKLTTGCFFISRHTVYNISQITE